MVSSIAELVEDKVLGIIAHGKSESRMWHGNNCHFKIIEM
jgi:hypothetical protein